jgi:hypothetical protein
MRFWRAAVTSLVVIVCACFVARAAVVDATAAEAAYKKGDFKAAQQLFASCVEQFRTASKNSQDFKVYREAAYLYDRLADCCFTQRDWDGLKLYLDGLFVVTVSERNLASTAMAGALESGISQASARFLAARLDEAVRFSTLIQLKRSIGLVLYDSKGKGAAGEGAIKQYQALAAAWRGVVGVENGMYSINVNVLDTRLDAFDKIYGEMSKLADLEVLWKKYEPESKNKQPAAPEAGKDHSPAPANTPKGGGKK